MPSAKLSNRSVLRIGGADATHFLQNLITCDVEKLSDRAATFGGLLTPQGKILFDFIIQKDGDTFLLDVAANVAGNLLKRLTFYRLRAAVTIEQSTLPVSIAWGGAQLDEGFADPRGSDVIRSFSREAHAANDDWHTQRIALGWPECGTDYLPETTFPHEALFDQFTGAGLAFDKGCYVGQEVVSRMQHRSTTRSRFVHISATAPLPDMGTEIVAGERKIGTLGSSSGTKGLALLRLDRTVKAQNSSQTISVGGSVLEITLPHFVTFDWPSAQNE